jgi:hypothetical protein
MHIRFELTRILRLGNSSVASEFAPFTVRTERFEARKKMLRRLEHVLGKHSSIVCVSLIAIACIRIVSTYHVLSLTVDEPIHMACGLEYLASHVYQLEPQHPPLARVMVALGPYLDGARPLGMKLGVEGVEVIARSANIDRTIFLMRLGILPFFVLACIVVWVWTYRSFDPLSAVLATGLFSCLPTVLADAGLATTDMALASTVGAAFVAGMVWAERPSWTRSLLFGICLGLAFLAKFTALGYVPAILGFALAAYLAVCWPGFRRLSRITLRYIAPSTLVIATTIFVIWAGYLFSFGPFQTHVFGSAAGRVRLPAPEFFQGIRDALDHNREGHGAFLLGHFSTTGWWYYFPVALAFKTPIAFLILFGVGLYVCIRERVRIAYLMPLAFSLGILVPAMKSHIDIGIRHVEPIYLSLSIVSALGLRELMQWSRARIVVAVSTCGLIFWMVLTGAVQHPDYLAYFNAFAGARPENVLVDSNYDWGQDLRLLAVRLRQLGVHQFFLATLSGVDRPEYLESWYGLPNVQVEQIYPPPLLRDSHVCAPVPGWNVVGVTFEKSLRFVIFGKGMPTPWYETVAPTERLGPLLLYNIPADTQIHTVGCE